MLDTHDDTTQRFFSKDYDLGKRNPDGHVDIPRMKEGGMNAIFFSIWIDGRIMGPPAVQKALDQIDAVHENVKKYSNDMVLARTAEDVRRAHAQGKIAALMGVEGGHMIGNDIRVVRIFADLGVRYMTLSHFYNDEWADSSTDKPAHNGLTDFGKDVVREMNRQGIMVDISHVSDKTFYDALEVSKAPLIASHSSCRALCNHVRDMTDDMIKALGRQRRRHSDQLRKELYRPGLQRRLRKRNRRGRSTSAKSPRAAITTGSASPREIGHEEEVDSRRQLTPYVSRERNIDHIGSCCKTSAPRPCRSRLPFLSD